MHIKFFLLFLLSGIQLCLAQQKNTTTTASANPAASQITYSLITNTDNTWGYDIYNDGKLFVHQPYIPGLSGNEGFKTKLSAESVAKLVVSKISKGEMPPTVTIDELKKLKAI